MWLQLSFHGIQRRLPTVITVFLTVYGFCRPPVLTNAADPREHSQVEATTVRDTAEQNKSTNHPPPHGSPAPELEGGVEWFNTSEPVQLKDLRGKFVILDFWTYCCINCMHVLPELKKLETAYPNNVVVIGVHSGKFDNEHDSESIRQAILRYDIFHPVVNDSDYKIWNSYGCRVWPTLRAIDPEGNIIASHTGEIDFATLDVFIKQNLPNYRAKGLLNERPLPSRTEANVVAETPLRFPGKILADEAGNRLFIADSGHNRIVVTSLDGKALSVIGAGTAGKADGGFTTAQFHHPQGMALFGNTLYVADTENHLLRRIDLTKQNVVTVAGTGQQAGPELAMQEASERFAGSPLSTSLNSPWALSINQGNLYVAMAGAHQIWIMPLDESRIGPYAGNGREDIVNGPLLPKLRYMPQSASFAQPSGLTSDGNLLYIADSEGSSVRAMPFTPTGKVETIVGTAALAETARLFTFGDVDGPLGKARFQHCMDVAYYDGQLYVADTYNHKIKIIDSKTHECKTLAGTGKPGYEDSPHLQSAQFFEPAGISCAAGKLYVADTNNHCVRVVDLTHDSISTLRISGL